MDWIYVNGRSGLAMFFGCLAVALLQKLCSKRVKPRNSSRFLFKEYVPRVMLTLVKDAKSQEIVGMYSKKSKSVKPARTVYYTHDVKPEKENVASARGVLEIHRSSLKRQHKISQAAFERICGMLDANEEPEVGDALRSEYWELKRIFERALKREMFLGDQDDVYFEHNLPRRKEDWPGTFTCIGNSGAGKTYWVVQMLLRYLRATKPHARRTIIWCSPEWEIDKTLKPLKETKYSFNVMGVDIGEDALRKSGKDAMTYYNEKIKRVIDEHGEKAIIVLDDFVDAAPALYPFLRKIYISSLRTARHKVTSVISLQHTYSGGRNTSQAIQSNKFIVFFPRSQQNRCIMFMRDHLMMQTAEAKELVQRFAKLDRWMTIRLHSPAAIYNSKYLLLL